MVRKLILFALTIASGVCLFAGDTSTSIDVPIRDHGQTVKKPQSVVDYFLLCPGFSFRDAYLDPRDTPYDLREFSIRQTLLRGGKVDGLQVGGLVFDGENDYLSIDGYAGDAFHMEFVFFDKADKSVVPAFSLEIGTPMGSEYRHAFYAFKNGNWTELTEVINPEPSLGEIQRGMFKENPNREFGTWAHWLYKLPRFGGTLLAVPKSFGEADGLGPDDQFARYSRYFNRLSGYAIRLEWDFRAGVFKRSGFESIDADAE